jgi:hypothetical protein
MDTINRSVFVNIGKKMLSIENNDLKIKYKNIICEGILEFKKKKIYQEIKKLDDEINYLLDKNNNNNNLKNKFMLEQYKLNELTITTLKSLRENYYHNLNNINL